MTGPRHPLPSANEAVSITVSEAAELLRIPVSAMRTLVRRKAIPSRKVGQEYRLHREAVLGWLREGDRT